MDESSTNILNLSESALKKLDWDQKILDLNEKVIVDADLHKLFKQIEKLTESTNQIVPENKKLHSDPVLEENTNHRLEEKIIETKYSRMQQVKIKGDSLEKNWSNIVCLSRPYQFNFFKDCLRKILLVPYLNILSQFIFNKTRWKGNSIATETILKYQVY